MKKIFLAVFLIVFSSNCFAAQVRSAGGGSSGGAGSGTVNSGLKNYLAKYPSTGTTVDDSAIIMDDGTNVGIGTVTPTAFLHIRKSTDGLVRSILENPSSGNSATAGYYAVSDGAGNDISILANSSTYGATVAGWSNMGVVNANSGTSGLTLSSASASGPILFETGGNGSTFRRVDIASDGNVGIGDMSPANKFVVGNGDLFQVSSAGAIAAVTGITTSGGYTQSGSGIDYFSGNVGVGSVTPGQALDINGFIRSTSLTGSKCVHTDATGTLTSAAADCGSGGSSAAGGTNAVQYNSGSATFAGVENRFSFNGSNVGVGTVNATKANLEVLKNSTDPYLKIESTVANNGDIITVDNTGNVGIGTNLTDNALLSVIGANVGIGTWKPNAPIQFKSSVAPQLSIANTSSQSVSIQPASILRVDNARFDVGANNAAVISVLSTNTGIGTLLPGTKLDVNGVIRGTGGSAALPTFVTTTGNSTTGAWGPSANNWAWSTNAVERARIDSNGNMGIGTVTPKSALSIVGNVGIGTMITDSYITNTAPTGGLILYGNVGIGTWLPSALLEVGTQKVDVLSGGNVGIGSLNPGAQLDVNGAIRTIGNTNNTTLNTTGGNVGIGTVTPGFTLDVAGNIRIVNTNSIGWSVVAGANTACNTTCTSGCVFGFDTGLGGNDLVDCTDATADRCVCAGAN